MIAKQTSNGTINRTRVLPVLAAACFLLVVSVSANQTVNAQPSFFDRNNTQGQCSPIITGNIGANATVKVSCSSDIPEGVVQTFEASLNEFFTTTIAPYFKEHQRTERNLNNFIENLQQQLRQAEDNYQQSIEQNQTDLQTEPENPWLTQEKQALQNGELIAAAQAREHYYLEKESQQLLELASDAKTVGDSWAAALQWQKATHFYKKSLNFNPGQTRLWWELYKIYVRFGNNSEVLASIEGFLANTPESDLRTQAVAIGLKGNWHLDTGNRDLALNNYQKALTIHEKLAKSDPENALWQLDLASSHVRAATISNKTLQKQHFEQAKLIIDRLYALGKLPPSREAIKDLVDYMLAENE